jgi:NAD(P) transhydrogenase
VLVPPVLRKLNYLVAIGHRCFYANGKINNTISEKPPLDGSGTPYASLTIGVPREVFPDERRVALTPQNVSLLLKKGFSKVLVERNAGVEAQFLDDQYVAAGARLVSQDELYRDSNIMLKVRPPLLGQEVELLKERTTVISFLYPVQNQSIVDTLAARKVNAFAVSLPFPVQTILQWVITLGGTY